MMAAPSDDQSRALTTGEVNAGLLSVALDGRWTVPEFAAALRVIDTSYVRFGALLFLRTPEGRAFVRGRYEYGQTAGASTIPPSHLFRPLIRRSRRV